METERVLLWSDDRIDAALYDTSGDYLAHAVAYQMRDEYEARIAELESIIAIIDEHAPRADSTCDEPGITLSEAARRELRDQKGE